MGFFTSLAIAGAAAAGSYMQGQAASSQAKAQAAMGRRNAEVAEKDALATEIKTRFDQVRHVEEGERAVSSLRARMGASGARLDEGAPLHIVAQQTMENELQNALIGYEGRTQSNRQRSQAAGYRAGAVFADARAKNAKTAGIINAGTSLLGNVGAMYDQGMFTSKSPSSDYGAPGSATHSGMPSAPVGRRYT